MNKLLLNGLIILVLSQSSAWAQATLWPVDSKNSTITFMGKSTTHDFEGKVGNIKGQLLVNDKDASANGYVQVDVLSLNTGNKTRDNNMYAMFNVKTFPLVSFDIQKADFSNVRQQEGYFQGTLNLHGVSRPLHVKVHVLVDKDTYECQGTFKVSLQEFGLKAPSVFGIIRVADQVNVQFKVIFHEKV